MPTGNESRIEPRAIQSDARAARRQMAPQIPQTRRASRPWAVGLLGLAIAVAFWGFGYKLSRYNLHSDTNSRASFAKLWDKHQDSAKIAETAKVTAQPHPGLEWRCNSCLPSGNS